jgi:hypothetical protein
MFIICAIFFAITIMGGAYLASKVMRNKETPKAIAFMHGGMGAVAIILLLISLCVVPVVHKSLGLVSLVLFILVAMGGFFLMIKDLTGKQIPKAVVIIHGAMALLGFAVLLIFIMNHVL